ncbi:right-handed parallel beta-helix repeat-containing protein [Aeromicrobium wangtongii]|uniref:Right-handed parallel beta-helix repeat-containing protein n=1 Tax=Aeromicrobium wangtongii TaxID=2969247 RepID=A0ABY5M531_9ACTN|nr:right-handed parallel beta-helix repeat-containing protein [Aeromicrobium wangtongii]MCD9200019.1 right-handed parallel beta-helix repeat-containing protein [Aeromicrobium wangtongii]UUP13279.1 right-handed parallel beta-helix repeat-containing protein [Aeromicrobium wangtongii]
MNTLPDHRLTPDERGDPASPRRTLVAFAAIVVVVVGAAVAITAASNEAKPSEQRPPAAAASPAPVTRTPAPGDIAQADLVDEEDRRLQSAVSGGTGRRGGVTTVVLEPREVGAYGVDDLIALGAASRQGRTITLRRPVVVPSGVSLRIHAPGATLRLAGSAAGPASVVAWGGSLTVSGTAAKPVQVIGWDRATRAPDVDETDGRGYLRVHSGRLAVKHASLEHLGFWSGRTGGLAATGTSFAPSKAQILDVSITAPHIGVYLADTRKVAISRTRVQDADRDGIQLDRSTGTRISDVTVAGSGLSGIRARYRSDRLSLSGGSVTGSAAYGIVADGRPRATGPNPAGRSVVNATGLTLTGTTVTDNRKGGVRIFGTNDASVDGLKADEDRAALQVIGRSSGTSVHDSVITSRRGAAIAVAGGALRVTVVGSTVAGTTSGITIADADVDVSGTALTIAKGHAVQVTDRRGTGSAKGNTVSGAGPHAFELADGADGFTVSDNDAQRWRTTHPRIEWIEHNPFALLWALILVVPALGLRFVVRRHRRHRDLRRLAEETVIAMARARRQGPAEIPDPLAQPPRAERPAPASLMGAPAAIVPAPPAPQAPRLVEANRIITRGTMGQFRSAHDLAVHAVLEGGKSPHDVARTLRVPVAVVTSWVDASRSGPT